MCAVKVYSHASDIIFKCVISKILASSEEKLLNYRLKKIKSNETLGQSTNETNQSAECLKQS